VTRERFLHIENVRLVDPGVGIHSGSVLIEGERIKAVNPDSVPEGAERHDGGGRLLTPGLMDLHTHGLGLWIFDQPEALLEGARLALRYGVTRLYPTIIPRALPGMLSHLEALAGMLDRAEGARLAGLHLEGPFMALSGAACPMQAGDLGLLEEIMAAARGRMAIMSLSPETPQIRPIIERLVARGVVPFITHTQATAAQTLEAIAAGARHATHFYDVFYSPPEQDPGVRPVGVLEAWLSDDRTTVDVIADGCHVDPIAIRALTRSLGWPRIVGITDSNIGAGLPPGLYETPWGFPVRVEPGRGARVASGEKAGALAGSALTLDEGIENLRRWLPELPPACVWAMATRNPARVMGLANAGRLQAGAEADLVLWDETPLRARRVWVGGRCLWERNE